MRTYYAGLSLLALVCACSAQFDDRQSRYIASEPKVAPTPVPILKQINRHNEDGSYTYGYEAADGSFKIETKEANGEVKGKYGYKDDTGKVRVVEYGANKYGFQPAGEGITVAPPTLVDESKEEERRASKNQQGSRNAYRTEEQPAIDYDYEEPVTQPPRPRAPAFRTAPQTFRGASVSPARPQKPQFFAGAAPAPAQLDQATFFNPEPAPRQQYRAPKQEYQPIQPQYQQAQAFPTQPTYTQAQPSFSQAQPSYSQAQPSYSQAQPTYTQTQASFPQPQSAFNQRSQPFSMLDQLLKEYALPQGGAAPLHDITFGSY